MDFRISDTFTGSLSRLSGDEQKAVKTTAFDLQINPANPGMQFHRIDRSKDPHFWSVRVSRDVRLIVHKTESSLLLCYVDHHDPAYAWAERRKIERHPRTGAAQLVEVRQVIREVPVVQYVAEEPEVVPLPLLFADLTDDELLAFGVPEEWLGDARKATEDSVLDLADRLPGEASEALLSLAVGERPQPALQLAEAADPFAHPDAQRRFRVVGDVEELERALDYPWEKWSVFLHPAQRALVERGFDGPARVAGSAGTGKTVVALHRATHMCRAHPESRVLLTTFSEPLASALRRSMRRLVGNEPRLAERLEVHALDAIARRLDEPRFGKAELVSGDELERLVTEASSDIGDKRLNIGFLLNEWRNVVDAWQLDTWEAYRDVPRLGRRVRLSEGQRERAWAVFERVISAIEEQGQITGAQLLGRLGAALQKEKDAPYRYVVVDEAQDVSVPQLRFLASLGGCYPDSLFFTGDLGQRIFQQPFSWKALGIDVRGRSHTLRVNYRTSHQIRTRVDQLLPPELSDVDGVSETRRGTISVFNGPRPELRTLGDVDAEVEAVGEWISGRIEAEVDPAEIAVFVRSEAELPRGQEALSMAGIPFVILDERLAPRPSHVSLTTMHLAKGLEFRAAAVIACDDEIIPLQTRIETVGEESELEEVYRSERHLLYVACTRAREHLLVTGVEPASEFLEDLDGGKP